MEKSMIQLAATPALERALQYHERGEFDAAEEVYRQILAAEPDNLEAVHCAGVLALQAEDYALAAQRLQRAVQLGANLGGTHFMLGRAYKAQGQLIEAISSYRRALEREPGMSDAYVSLGIALKEQGQLDQAAAAYREGLFFNAKSFEARLNLGNVYQLQGKFDEALAEYKMAEALRPDVAELHYNIGKVLRAQGRDTDATERFRNIIERLQRAVALDADYLEAYFNLGNALDAAAQYEPAVECYRRLRRLLESGAGRPRAAAAARAKLHLDTLSNLAGTLVRSMDYEAAMPVLQEALVRAPQSIPLLEYLLVVLPYRAQRRDEVLETYARYQQTVMALRPAPARGIERAAARAYAPQKLRIGYVSADFRDHSVAFFLEPILAHHDRQAFEVVCYSNNKQDDAVTERLRAHADAWVDAKPLDDTALAQRVAKDHIDILIDLSGRTLGNRLGLFLSEPALLQVGYLGYSTYTGVRQIAYRVTDAHIDPDEEPGLDSERPLRLARSMFCYRPPLEAPAVAEAPVATRGYICFGSFNQVPKLSPEILTDWAQILAAVPDARLLLKAGGFANPRIKQRVHDTFARHGIAPERVLLRENEPERSAHLALYGEVDIALDTFPYNGATTTCEALWMGVPVITRAGETHPSRMGTSILSALGLHDLITHTQSDYVAAAVALANDPARLRELRSHLRPRFAASPLRDEAGFTRDFEQTLRGAWEACAQQAAAQG